MKKTQKIKTWIHKNRYEIGAYAVFASVIALAVAGEIATANQQEADAKRQNKEQKALNEYIVAQNREGKTVVQLADGSFLGVAL